MIDFSKAVVTTPSDREVVVTRSFAAPSGAVYAAFTRPDLVRRWLIGPPGWTMPVCEIDLKVGGRYHYRWASAEGAAFGFSGEYKLIEPRRLIEHVERPDDMPGECQCSLSFEEIEGKTRIALSMTFDSEATRDAAIATGMTDGMETTYQTLDQLLAEGSA